MGSQGPLTFLCFFSHTRWKSSDTKSTSPWEWNRNDCKKKHDLSHFSRFHYLGAPSRAPGGLSRGYHHPSFNSQKSKIKYFSNITSSKDFYQPNKNIWKKNMCTINNITFSGCALIPLAYRDRDYDKIAQLISRSRFFGPNRLYF